MKHMEWSAVVQEVFRLFTFEVQLKIHDVKYEIFYTDAFQKKSIPLHWLKVELV